MKKSAYSKAYCIFEFTENNWNKNIDLISFCIILLVLFCQFEHLFDP